METGLQADQADEIREDRSKGRGQSVCRCGGDICLGFCDGRGLYAPLKEVCRQTAAAVFQDDTMICPEHKDCRNRCRRIY